ncbi:MAG: hypothetical protein AAGF73_17725 [Actinomycetota bacterium]
MLSIDPPLDDPVSCDLTLGTDGQWRPTADGERATAHLEGADRFLRATYASGGIPVGPSTAPAAARLWSFVEREFGTSIGALDPAPPANAV